MTRNSSIFALALIFLVVIFTLQVKKLHFVNSKDISLEMELEKKLNNEEFFIYPLIPESFFTKNNMENVKFSFSFPNTLIINYDLPPIVAYFEGFALLENGNLQRKNTTNISKPQLKLENSQISREDFIKTFLIFHNLFATLNKQVKTYRVLTDKTIEMQTSDGITIKFRQDFSNEKLNSLSQILKQYDKLNTLDFRYRSGVALKFDYE